MCDGLKVLAAGKDEPTPNVEPAEPPLGSPTSSRPPKLCFSFQFHGHFDSWNARALVGSRSLKLGTVALHTSSCTNGSPDDGDDVVPLAVDP